ncbi:MAG: glutamate racemase [bacterium]|nr:glutamate racemase [bacterium]
MKNAPIGIFDSGIGGLTVAHAIWEKLPRENIVYLGDTARVPYGTRGREVISLFARQLARFLLKREVKVMVVACNTISSTCLNEVKALSPVPVIDALSPAAETAVKTTRTGVVGVIGTRATIESGAYEAKIKILDPKIKILTAACPLFVPLAEEGLADHPAADLIARDYLTVFSQTSIDTLILGCTHYPLLKETIRKVLDRKVSLIDSARPVAENLADLLERENLSNDTSQPVYEFFVTDAPQRVKETAERFFGHSLPGEIQKISLEKITDNSDQLTKVGTTG